MSRLLPHLNKTEKVAKQQTTTKTCSCRPCPNCGHLPQKKRGCTVCDLHGDSDSPGVIRDFCELHGTISRQVIQALQRPPNRFG